MDVAQLLTRRDAEAVIGRPANRFEPTGDAGRPAGQFVCFGAPGTRAATLGEFVSLALAPSRDGERDVPFFAVAVEAEAAASDTRARRSVAARWEQAGRRLSLTYTCVSLAEHDDAEATTAAKRDAVAALAREVSDRISALLRR